MWHESPLKIVNVELTNMICYDAISCRYFSVCFLFLKMQIHWYLPLLYQYLLLCKTELPVGKIQKKMRLLPEMFESIN